MLPLGPISPNALVLVRRSQVPFLAIRLKIRLLSVRGGPNAATKGRKERIVSFDSELGLREMRYAHLSQSHQKVPTLSWAVEKNKNFPRLIHASKQASIQKTI